MFKEDKVDIAVCGGLGFILLIILLTYLLVCSVFMIRGCQFQPQPAHFKQTFKPEKGFKKSQVVTPNPRTLRGHLNSFNVTSGIKANRGFSLVNKGNL